MNFSEYDAVVRRTAQYGGWEKGWLLYPALGLCGEAGEVAEKIKKLVRNSSKQYGSELDETERRELLKEVSDVLWYISALAQSLNSTSEEVAKINSSKLLDRLDRGVIKSSGDNR